MPSHHTGSAGMLKRRAKGHFGTAWSNKRLLCLNALKTLFGACCLYLQAPAGPLSSLHVAETATVVD